MPKYIIERKIPGVHQLNARDRKAAATKSNRALSEVGPEIQWVHSYVIGDKTHCVYIASSEKLIHEHAKKSGFPADNIYEVSYILEPGAAEG